MSPNSLCTLIALSIARPVDTAKKLPAAMKFSNAERVLSSIFFALFKRVPSRSEKNIFFISKTRSGNGAGVVFANYFPVDEAHIGFNVVGAEVLVFEVIRVFPNIDAAYRQASCALADRVVLVR